MKSLSSSPGPWRWLSIAGCCLGPALGCGGEQFTSEPAASGGSGAGAMGGRGGTTDRGGSGGMTSGGGTSEGGDTGSSGSGGSVSCACDAGQYCRAGNCRDCSDFSVLEFGAAELLGALDDGEANPSFPRSAGADGALFYSTEHPTMGGHIYFTPDFMATPGQHVSGANSPPEVGPLYIDNSGGLDFNLLFTRPSVIMMADWDGLALSGVAPVPGAVNNDSSADYSVAFAPGTTRLWWMSDRSGVPALYTTLLNDFQNPEQQVPVEIPGATGACDATYPDLTPWVTSDGAFLLFSAEAAADQCGADTTTDLYAVPLTSDGVPIATAIALDDVNLPASDEVTPSLSADSCWLYFSSDEGSGSFNVYRAPRR